MAPQMPPAAGINMSSSSNNSISRSTRGADYNKEALHQIRVSLQPYANGGPRERLSPNITLVTYQNPYNLPSPEDDLHRSFNGYPKTQVFPLESPIIRKASFERDLAISRGSPALDSNASTRSDSPGILYPCSIPLVSPVVCQGHQFSYVCGVPPEPSPPPPPPPRSQGIIGPPPPPTPPRGITPPLYSSSTIANTYVATASQRPVILSRLSPGPAKTKSTANYVNISSIAQSPCSQRGASPVSLVCRQPVIIPNSPQVQQQLTQQMQVLSMNASSGHSYSSQVDRPPPYPVGNQMKPISGGVKMTTSPPTYTVMMQNRHSPTQECRKSPQLTFQTGCIGSSHPITSASLSPTLAVPPMTMVLGEQTAPQQSVVRGALSVQPQSMVRAGRTVPSQQIVRGGQKAPIIMQSVKSTQVQKPVLQTAVAPVTPPLSTPPPSYASSIQQKQTQPKLDSNIGSVPVTAVTSSCSVPTTDPPSYHSTMQAMAVARGYSYMPHAVASIPLQDVPLQDLDLSSTPLAHIAISQVSTGESIITTQPTSQVETVSSCRILTPTLAQMPSHSPIQRKFSPAPTDTTSSASRSESPTSSVASHDTHALSQSPVSCLSMSTSAPSTQSDMTQESGYSSSSQSARMGLMPPPPPPPNPLTPLPSPDPSLTPSPDPSLTPTASVDCTIEKTLHESPLAERKKMSAELEDQRFESKVKVYSPEAYKFFMEQHVENVLKFHDQRKQRKIQLERELKKIGLSTKDQSELRKVLSQLESNYIRLKRAKMNKLMFQRIKTIGVGAFGEVALVLKTDTRQLYAMKTLRKADVLKRNQVAHVKAERDILAEADNEWVVKLYYSFQDKDNLYLIMDYIPGGDLMSLLIKFGIFEESLARFYIGELVCAVESVHKMGFIHRDIKPDNILIDKDGHIKLTDFGLCTGFRWTHNSKYYQLQGDHNRQDSIDPCGDNDIICRCNDLKPLERRRRRQHLRCLAHSLVGTPNYIAPEVLSRTGYTQLCDWWSVGVILYEMLVGQPPFLANTPADTQYKVINWETTLRIPKLAKLSNEAKDLILNLCTHPERRLGRNGALEVKQHPFFTGLDFEGGLRKQQALYTPKIKYPTDTSNFDPIDPDRLRPSEANEGELEWINSNDQPIHGFFEFTFRRFFDSTPGASSSEEKEKQHPIYV